MLVTLVLIETGSTFLYQLTAIKWSFHFVRNYDILGYINILTLTLAFLILWKNVKPDLIKSFSFFILSQNMLLFFKYVFDERHTVMWMDR